MLTTNFSPFPELATKRLTLKKITEADAPAVFILRSDTEVMKYIGRPLAQTEADALTLIRLITTTLEANEGITWGIFENGDKDLKGTIGFWRMEKENYRAEIGYLLHPALQGKGYMREAMKAVLDYGFKNMNLHSVEAIVSPDNAASIGLLKKAGFQQEAYFKENFFYNGCFLDSAVYSLLAPAT